MSEILKKKSKKLAFRSKCYTHEDERELLLEFKALLEKKLPLPAYDQSAYWMGLDGSVGLYARHGKRISTSFMDGHVEEVDPNKLPELFTRNEYSRASIRFFTKDLVQVTISAIP